MQQQDIRVEPLGDPAFTGGQFKGVGHAGGKGFQGRGQGYSLLENAITKLPVIFSERAYAKPDQAALLVENGSAAVTVGAHGDIALIDAPLEHNFQSGARLDVGITR